MFFYLFLSLAVLALLSLILFSSFPLWASLLCGVGFFLLLNLLYLAFLWVASLIMKPSDKKPNGTKFARFMIMETAAWFFVWLRVKIVLNGFENLPNVPYIFISNHRSWIDPLTACAYLKNTDYSFISKQENMKLPIAGKFFQCGGILAIDRENSLRAMRTVRRAAALVRDEGFNVGIFPEGTRSHDKKLLPFKTGAFFAAQKANCPVVVIAMRGTEKIFHNVPWRSTKVFLDLIDVIPAEIVVQTDTEELAALCREKIAAFLSQAE